MALQVWLPLNGNLNNQGLNQKIIPSTLGTVSYDNNGKIGKCFISGGTSQLTNGISLNTNFINMFNNENGCSIAVWIKPVGNHFHYNGTIVSSGNWNSQCWSFGVSQDNTKVDVLCKGYNAYISCNIPVNEWTHLVGTYKNGISKIYKNGIYIGELTGRVAFNSDASNTCIGRETYANGYFGFNGRINDVRIYDHCLSPKEVKELSKGLVLHYKLDNLIGKPTHNLPKEYQELEYIESTGTSYFNTGVKFNIENDSCTVIFKGNDLSNNGMIFASSGSQYFWLYYYSSNGIRIYADNTTGQQGIVGINRDTEKHTMIWQNKKYFIDNIYKGTFSKIYSETTNNIWLFSYGGSGYPFKGRIYYTDIKNNSTYKRIFIPAKRISDSVVGMYDLITKTFYTSSGSNAFTAGPIIQNNIIYDSSGYQNNGSILGQLTVNENSPKYNYSTNFDGNTAGILIENLYIGNIINTALTYSFWIKPNGENGARSVYFGSYSGTTFNIEKNTSNKLRLYWGGSPDLISNLTITDNQWQHIVITKNGTTEIKVYLNGELIQTLSNTYNNITFPTTFRLGRDSRSGDGTPYKGLMSDFRIYSTVLSGSDILELYNNPANIDNQGNMFSFEFDEEEVNKQQILKTGITKINNFIEINDKIKVLNDGSVFLQILHHNNPASNLFTVSNCWLNNSENLYSALILLKNIFNNLTEYEFLACEKAESSTTSETQFRWKQTSNPALSSTITGKTIISGSVTYNQGLKTNGSYAAMHNGSTWWCACGSYTAFSGGIPGFNSVIKSGYLDLYIRISEEVLKGTIGDNLKFFKKSILSNQIIEK